EREEQQTVQYRINKRRQHNITPIIHLGNTAQSAPDGFARNLLADFPSDCPEIPCHTAETSLFFKWKTGSFFIVYVLRRCQRYC
ncbi:MAG: hypothetical protein SOY50_09140, partial [Ruminococcus callidus]|nr:hypothetical protein [Ruminococcus callidus]